MSNEATRLLVIVEAVSTLPGAVYYRRIVIFCPEISDSASHVCPGAGALGFEDSRQRQPSGWDLGAGAHLRRSSNSSAQRPPAGGPPASLLPGRTATEPGGTFREDKSQLRR